MLRSLLTVLSLPPSRLSLLPSRLTLNPSSTLAKQTPNLEDEVDLHFVTFVEHNGALIELDGRRNSPVNHGEIKEGLLEVRSFYAALAIFSWY